MPNDFAVDAKAPERARLEADLARFLANKGKVEVLGNTPFRKPELLSVKDAALASASRHFSRKGAT
ncbi:hypothetical protein [Pseudoxanthomonas composti]|uniref:Uncharacterized protein n=1 Tax=Pseudoxanthomonas composti TaxID=2137479 RepID=A0A4Q1JR68_9GAMM|nr:hypothetical protein [Pseudoxanthomonas composti]RXQ99922.1 hypothetical protein EPA99_17515 [Pseudoxanthomonas composti]